MEVNVCLIDSLSCGISFSLNKSFVIHRFTNIQELYFTTPTVIHATSSHANNNYTLRLLILLICYWFHQKHKATLGQFLLIPADYYVLVCVHS